MFGHGVKVVGVTMGKSGSYVKVGQAERSGPLPKYFPLLQNLKALTSPLLTSTIQVMPMDWDHKTFGEENCADSTSSSKSRGK